MLEVYKNIIAEEIKKSCIEVPKELMFGKLTGTRYSSQYYMANLLYNASMMSVIADAFFELMNHQEHKFEIQLAGRDWSSIPLLSGIPIILAQRHNININSFLIKRERKKYGKHNYIEGIPNYKPVLIVDDLCNSTDSFRHCKAVCDLEGLETTPYIFAVLNKYSRKRVGDDVFIDRYLRTHRALSIVERDDL